MDAVSIQPKDHSGIAIGIQLKQLLDSLNLPAALYDTMGNCLQPMSAQISESDSACTDYQECFACVLNKYDSQSVKDQPYYIVCPSGGTVLAVPLHRRQHTVAFLLCCLRSAQFCGADIFQRLCEKATVDQSIFEPELTDALSARQIAPVMAGLLQSWLKQAQGHLDNAGQIEQMANSLTQTYEELTLLHQISDRMRITHKPEAFFPQLARDIVEVVEAEKVIVFYGHPDKQDGNLPSLIEAGTLKLDRSHLEKIWHRTLVFMRESEGILIDSDVDGPYIYSWPKPIRNLVSVPVRRNEKLMGALVAVNKIDKPDFDSINNQLLISIGNEIAVFLENISLYQEMQQLFYGSLRALSSSIDAKDPYTCGHSARVALICQRLAEQLELDPAHTHTIYLVGLLHDVGKIGVDDAILCKPGPLNEEEFRQIQMHPRIGANILKPIKQMDQVALAVFAHHERFDGRGYPCGLAGQDIPLAGRIVMLADAFDTMISDRIYRKAKPLASVLAEIRRFCGTQFDPKITDIFLKLNLPALVTELNTLENESYNHPLDFNFQPTRG